MRRALCCFPILFALACAGALAAARPPPARTAPAARCAIDAAGLRCGEVQRTLAELGIAAPVRASVRRRLGGMWVLDADRILVRIDARARVTGRAAESGGVLLASAEFVCVGAGARLRCRVDYHDDAGCGAAQALDPALTVDPGFAPAWTSGDAVMCGPSPQGTPRCVRLSRPCGLGCLRFPACGGARRCVLDCAPGAPAIAARRVEPPDTHPPLHHLQALR